MPVQPGHHREQAGPAAPLGRRALGGELGGVHPARHDGHRRPGHAHAHQVGRFGAGAGQHGVGASARARPPAGCARRCRPRRCRGGVPRRRACRTSAPAGCRGRGRRRGRRGRSSRSRRAPRRACSGASAAASWSLNSADGGGQFGAAQRGRRARGDVLDGHPRGEDRAAGQRARVPPGVDGDPVPELGQPPRVRGDAGGLGHRLLAGGRGERAAVVSDEGDPHHDASWGFTAALASRGALPSRAKKAHPTSRQDGVRVCLRRKHRSRERLSPPPWPVKHRGRAAAPRQKAPGPGDGAAVAGPRR